MFAKPAASVATPKMFRGVAKSTFGGDSKDGSADDDDTPRKPASKESQSHVSRRHSPSPCQNSDDEQSSEPLSFCSLCGDKLYSGDRLYRDCLQHYDCALANKAKNRIFAKDLEVTDEIKNEIPGIFMFCFDAFWVTVPQKLIIASGPTIFV